MSNITRRDFINGTLMAAGASVLPFGATGHAALDRVDPQYYPPAMTGLRGNHAGSNTCAHSRALDERSDWGPTTELKEEHLGGILSAGLFDFDRDVESITVNRWAHGYCMAAWYFSTPTCTTWRERGGSPLDE